MALLEGLRRERAIASPQYRDGRFRNPSGLGPGLQPDQQQGIFKDFFFGGKKRRPPGPIPYENPRQGWTHSSMSGLRLTWLGHSTLLVEIDGCRILTDPVFGDRASPFSFAGPKRFHPVPARIADLPELDAVLVSHDHHDHLNPESVRELGRRNVPIVTSLGVGAHLEAAGVPSANIIELDWWETYRVPRAEVALHACPSQHFSGRGLFDRNMTLWSSWVMESPKHKVFFSGDTGLTEDFREIAARFGPFDLTMLEIGAFHPAWGTIHLGPDNALTALEWLGGGTLLPVHWATFDLGLHPWHEPAERLYQQSAARGARIITPRLGRPFEPSHLDGPDPWWREVLAHAIAPNALHPASPLPEASR